MISFRRNRRNRKSQWSRGLSKEISISPNDLILPLFITHKKTNPIKSMQNVYRLSVEDALKTIDLSLFLNIRSFILFPIIETQTRSQNGHEAYNPNNLICNAIKKIKKQYGNEIGVIADVALDPYTKHGHDGLLDSNNYVDNDKTIEALCKQALVLAAAGADAIAPSDMMDGRVQAIRNALDGSGFICVNIISYSAKYCSNLYGPFREALNGEKKINKSTYQIDFHNAKDAELSCETDIKQGADMIIIKPATLYLDIIYRISKLTKVPILGYQVSGEYSMIRSMPNYHECLYESAISIKRAGADGIISYAALDIAKSLK